MRDDLHKHVPAPSCVQTWVKHALRPADRGARSAEALKAAVLTTIKSEIAPAFLTDLRTRLIDGIPNLFGPLSDIPHSRNIGGLGTIIEQDILDGCRRLIAEGQRSENAFPQAIKEALEERFDAHLRAAQPVLLASDDPRASDGMKQLRQDREQLDLGAFAHACARQDHGAANAAPSATLSADENLLRPTEPAKKP